jgi:hypothetical protein
MPDLARRRDTHAHWLIFSGDVQVGTIADAQR